MQFERHVHCTYALFTPMTHTHTHFNTHSRHVHCAHALRFTPTYNTTHKTHQHSPVDAFPPTQRGVHDAFGNAWEWQEDHFSPLPGMGVGLLVCVCFFFQGWVSIQQIDCHPPHQLGNSHKKQTRIRNLRRLQDARALRGLFPPLLRRPAPSHHGRLLRLHRYGLFVCGGSCSDCPSVTVLLPKLTTQQPSSQPNHTETIQTTKQATRPPASRASTSAPTSTSTPASASRDPTPR